MDPKCDHCPLRDEDRACRSYPVLCDRIRPDEEKSPDFIELWMKVWDKVNKSPSLGRKAANLAGSLYRFARSGFKFVDDETYKERQAICKACPDWDAKTRRCTVCTCLTDVKLKMASEKCPKDKWLPMRYRPEDLSSESSET